MSTLIDVCSAVRAFPVGVALHTLDPGLDSPALVSWSQGVAGGEWMITDAVRGRPKLSPKDDVLARAVELAGLLARRVGRCVGERHALVSEVPESREAGRSVNRPDQLHGMVAVAAALAHQLVGDPRDAMSLSPTEWCGNVPKTTTGDARKSVRGGRVWGLLTDVERQLLERLGLAGQHDVLDAVGIGLCATGRARRGVVSPRRRS